MQFLSDILPDVAGKLPSSTHIAAGESGKVDQNRALTPKDLLELPSVGTGVPNPPGTLIYVSYSTWSQSTDVYAFIDNILCN